MLPFVPLDGMRIILKEDVEYTTAPTTSDAYHGSMDMRGLFRRKIVTSEQPASAPPAHRFSIVESVQGAVVDFRGERVDRARAEVALAGKLMPLIDKALAETTPPEEAKSDTETHVRDQLGQHSDELRQLVEQHRKQAEQPELPPDGDKPAA